MNDKYFWKLLQVFISYRYAPIAQLVEHLTCNEVVAGSSPAWSFS